MYRAPASLCLSLLSILLCLAVVQPALAESIEGTSQHAIINGEGVGTEVHPSAGQLILGGTLEGQEIKQPVCTAVLIAPDVVLTAAHCLSDFSITFGIFELEDMTFWISFEESHGDMLDSSHQGNPPLPESAVEASGFVGHPDFSMTGEAPAPGPGRFDDIGLVFLSEPITSRDHAWLPSAEEDASLEEGQALEIIGYGQQTVGSGNPFEPPDPETTFIRVAGESFINELAEFEMQVGDDPESTRKCHGDSGGPSYAQVPADTIELRRVVGVTSRAYDERDCEVGGLDTRVGAYLEWIEEEMLKACEDGTRSDCEEPGIPRPPSADDLDDDSSEGGCECSSLGREDAGPFSALLILGLGMLCRRRVVP